MEDWFLLLTQRKEVVQVTKNEEEGYYVECINRNSVAEEILDEMKKHLGENYHYGIKSYNKYWKENSNNNNLIVYAKEKE